MPDAGRKLSQPIHLSVVATSRNDNHGGSLTHRMQHFVDGFVAQCKRHDLRAELIMVEWNPPADRLPLAEELRWPSDTGPCDIRIVTVPRDVHQGIAHADKIPLYQMVAKNVGIRRARGRFVLATNIDILFSDQVVVGMRDRLQSGRLYRTQRVDVPTEVPQTDDFSRVLEFCRQEGFRIHAPANTVTREGGEWSRGERWRAMLDPRVQYFLYLLRLPTALVRLLGVSMLSPARAREKLERFIEARGANDGAIASQTGRDGAQAGVIAPAASLMQRVGRFVWQAVGVVPRRLIFPWPFTNACGDFTLLSKEDWARLGGYPEWPIFSWHLDSILLYQAEGVGLREESFGPQAPVYHIEHGKGSGYTPEGADALFSSLLKRGIPFLSNAELRQVHSRIRSRARMEQGPLFNGPAWGMADRELPEHIVRQATRI